MQNGLNLSGETLMEPSSFARLRAVNVNEKVEKKNGFSYLSWAYAVDQLLQLDPAANWEYQTPIMYGDTMMVSCTVTAFGKAMTAQLPVMDHRNNPIPNPNAFQVNTAMQRCLVKGIALHGLGLYLYAGEDLPEGASPQVQAIADKFLSALNAEETGTTEEEQHARKSERLRALHAEANKDADTYREAWKLLDSKQRSAIKVFLGQTR